MHVHQGFWVWNRGRETFVPDDLRREFVNGLRNKFSETTYNLFTNNCNNFSDELAQFLTDSGIPVRGLSVTFHRGFVHLA